MSPGAGSISAGTMAVSFIVFAIPAGILASKFGRRRTIQIGLIGLTLLLLVGYVVIRSQITFIAVLALAGGFWALVNVNSLPLVYDHGDERRIGAYTGLYYFASQAAAVIGPTLAGVMVDALGVDLSVGYRWVWVFGAVFMGLALLTMTRVGEVKTGAQPAWKER
jgi:MFS family permease